MGACCGGGIQDEEIKNAKDLNDLIKLFDERKNKLPEEKKQIQDHCDDPTKEVDAINVGGIDIEILKKRIPYLDEVEEAYEKIISNLKNNPTIPLSDAKSYCSNIASHYFLTYDPNGELKADVEKFDQFISKWQAAHPSA